MNNTELANPAPLGLTAFGMTTILLNLYNAGFFALDDLNLSMRIFYCGIAQILAGLLEYKKGNTFGLTAFASYGSFWLTLVAVLLMPKEDGAGRCARSRISGFLSGTVGGIHAVNVFWHTEICPDAAVCFPESDGVVFIAGCRKYHFQSIRDPHCGVGRVSLWSQCCLFGYGGSA